ncbi:hypothetical protein [Dasineura jujubifolia toursvirus 2a]|nr:hypothetical protein [Dasineura jujubifolia toursvirus 2a]
MNTYTKMNRSNLKNHIYEEITPSKYSKKYTNSNSSKENLKYPPPLPPRNGDIKRNKNNVYEEIQYQPCNKNNNNNNNNNYMYMKPGLPQRNSVYEKMTVIKNYYYK